MQFLPQLEAVFKPTSYELAKSSSVEAQKLGFTQLKVDSSSSVQIVDKSEAEDMFDDIIKLAKKKINDSKIEEQLQHIKSRFSKMVTSNWDKMILGSPDRSAKKIKLLRIFYIKKKTQALFFYSFSSFQYKEAPRLIKLFDQSSSQRSSRFLCFGSSFSSYQRSQRWVQVSQGTNDEINALVQLSAPDIEQIKKRILI